MKSEENETIRRIEVAQDFARKIYDEFGTFIKAVVLFGSTSRQEQKHGSDIDIMVIVDDVTANLTQSTVEAYRIVLSEKIAQVSKKLHVTSLKLSTFWELVRVGDPVALGILRDGTPIIDSGFFDPLKQLLSRGKIRPSEEAVRLYLMKSSRSFSNAKWHVNQAVIDLYWAVIDSLHSALMRKNVVPTHPDSMADLAKKEFYDDNNTKIINSNDISLIRDLVNAQKKITKDNSYNATGEMYDKLLIRTEKCIAKLNGFVGKKK
ncbi:MAG: nucleotidyltransferase domain-containing protein [Candidatus Woesearchaeota archaeon]